MRIAVSSESVEETGLPQKTVERAVEDLVSLRLSRREKVSGKWHVTPSRISREYWGIKRSPEKLDLSQNGRPDIPEEEIERLADLARGMLADKQRS